MYVRVDGEGWEHLRMSGIVEDYRNDYTVRKEDGFINQGPIKNWRKTTKVWKLLVTWKYRISTWYNLKGLKESNPVEVTECGIAKCIVGEPYFAWWETYFLRRRDRIPAKFKSHDWNRTHKFSVETPQIYEEAYQIYNDSGTY